MGKLYGWLVALLLVFSASMTFAAWSVYALSWWQGAVAGVTFLAFLGGVGTALGTLRTLTGPRLLTGRAALQAFASLCGLEFFTMALVTWILGKRSLPYSNAYEALGLLIFLGLLGVGIQGAVAMIFRFLFVRNRQIVAPRRAALAEERAAHMSQLEGAYDH